MACNLVLTLLGSLVLCLYGMKVMSQGILKVAGSHLRASLRGISNNRSHSLWTGTWLTALMQSSSATTVMTISLVNAGLITLGQSIALIMGANVGTTFTAWIIATFGYCFDCRLVAIPLVILALPFTYSGFIKYKPWGEVFMGIALYLLGFTTFIHQMPHTADFPATAATLYTITHWGFWSVLLFAAIGIGVTFIFRSSAATILLAMALLANGWMEFPLAAALVIGDNIGTTLTGVLASRHANISARRAAYSHLAFNVFGLLWSLLLIYPLTEAIWQLITWGSGLPSATQLAYGIALYHTLFNLVSALLLIGFIPQFKRLLARFLPIVEGDEDEFHLHFIRGGMLSTAELSVEEARKEAALFGIRCQKMLQITDQFLHLAPEHPHYNHTLTRIDKYEKITDRLELEIIRYLNQIDRAAMSGHMSARVRAIFRIVDELESIGDACYKLARTAVRKNEHGIRFIAMQQQNLDRMLTLSHQAIDQMTQLLQKPELTDVDLQRAYNQEDAINSLRSQLREQNIANVQAGHYSYQSGALYMDMINACEKLSDYIINVIEAHSEQSDYDLDEE